MTGQLDLKSPNELSDSEYNNYSAAAIGGTLVLLLPIGLLDGALLGFLRDFVISALLGGGLLAFLALRKDQAAELANLVRRRLDGCHRQGRWLISGES